MSLDKAPTWEDDPDVFTWDHREQPDIERLGELLARYGLTVTEIDTGSDPYAIRISGQGHQQHVPSDPGGPPATRNPLLAVALGEIRRRCENPTGTGPTLEWNAGYTAALTEIRSLASAAGPEEQAEFDHRLAELHAVGFVDIAAHGALRIGSRIRHRGDQWPAALQRGTGNIVALAQNPNSSWSRQRGRPDIELIARWDHTGTRDRFSSLADYHVALIEGTGGADE